MWEEKRSKQLSKGVRLWEGVGEAGGEEERRGLFDPGIHLAFMVWRRLSSPLNFVFRWREPERWEGDCGAGLRSPRTPPIWEAHVLGPKWGEGGSVLRGGISKCHLMPWKKEVLLGWTLALSRIPSNSTSTCTQLS